MVNNEVQALTLFRIIGIRFVVRHVVQSQVWSLWFLLSSWIPLHAVSTTESYKIRERYNPLIKMVFSLEYFLLLSLL